MSTECFYLLSCVLLLPILTISSCSPYKFTCGNYTLQIQPPFFTNSNPTPNCKSLHLIQCMNLAPVIQLHGFFYPVSNISYHDKTLIIHDLRLSSFFRGSNCVFLYDFESPIPNFNVSNFTETLSPNSTLFDCDGAKRCDLSSNALFRDEAYDLYYGNDLDGNHEFGYCGRSRDLWFDWRLSFEGKDEFFSLLSAGFSRKWTSSLDCFDCMIEAGNCSSQHCRGLISSGVGAHTKKIMIGGVSVLGVLFLSCILCIFCYRQRSKKNLQFYEKDLESIGFHCQTHLFSYKELEGATNSFDASRELGDGGYGTVYKGVLKDGRVVAVKRLYETNYKRLEQFTNEVEILSCLRHPNLVTLYGSTSPNSPHLLLVYEFIPNGTLADHLHNPLLSKTLPLPLRLSIAMDVASALSYLHSMDIIHRDVKTNNILLDNNFNAKVADFGLSRLFPANVTHVSTAPQGTPGYLDPEYHRFYQLTDKSDVYSFGVVLMELISSRPAVDIGRCPDEISLAMAAVSKIQKGELGQLVDLGLGFDLDGEAKRIITQMAELGFRCLQVDREMRPCIKEVLEELREIERAESSSPCSVMCDWVSRSTITNASEQGII